MKTDDFEKRLQRQPLRQIPPEWRGEILEAARAASPRLPTLDPRQTGWLSTLNQQLSAILWPNPKAWAGLMAVWIVILTLHFAVREEPESVAKKMTPPSPEVIAALKEQGRFFAELIGSSEASDADSPKPATLQPHSERRREAKMA
jgi:hypothetical protein